MPESERSEEGMSSWDEPSELLIVTRFVTGTLSFSHVISGRGDACKKGTLGIYWVFNSWTSGLSPVDLAVLSVIKLKCESHLEVHCDPNRVSCPHHHETLHLVVRELWPYWYNEQEQWKALRIITLEGSYVSSYKNAFHRFWNFGS